MSRKVRILVVDDEPAILRFLKPLLTANDYQVETAGTASDGIRCIASQVPDIVVLDLGLPDQDGTGLIRTVRQWSDVPIIVLSARDREIDKIEALDLGADDYLSKPFGAGELMARLRGALRHHLERRAEKAVVSAGKLEIDNVRHRVTLAGTAIKLTPKEFELLSFLARHAGKVLTHKQILTAVWGASHTADTPYLRVHIGHLRQKIEEDANEPRIIVTESGIGYRFVESV